MAIATVMLHRANCCVVTGEPERGLAELRAAISFMPGEPSAEVPPTFDVDGAINWGNHLSYLRLAELVGDVEEGDRLVRAAYERFGWLASEQLGASTWELSRLLEHELVREANRIIETNLGRPRIGERVDSLQIIASPLWTPGDDHKSVRKGSLVPHAFVEYCYGAALKDPATSAALAQIAVACVMRFRDQPWRLAKLTAEARKLYINAEAPVLEVVAVRQPSHLVLSALLAEAGRLLRAGASLDEIRAHFGLDADARLHESLADKLAALEAWEGEQYIAALGA
jgi:hypothetical protein